ncbi:MAG: hypothetical protein H7Y20_01210 [Bryobacteraceae bacterium]|nr:hypothetical protein [Bryobacteraceae bacterium]
MRLLLALTVSLSWCASAQSPTDVFDKAPPKIDDALRARVTKFFEAHVGGKFRQAEQVIHSTSLDEFYNSEKQRLIGFEIANITYSDNFTKAMVVTNVELDWITVRLGKIRVKPPMKSTWMYDAGEWWWYVIPRKEWETPWGNMKPGAERSAGYGGPSGVSMPDVKAILSQVVVSKTAIHLSSAEKSTDTAEILNKMPGDLTLAIEPVQIPGLKVRIDKELLHSGETARITFDHEPTDRSVKVTRTVRVNASPTGQHYEFTLTFAVPEELKKYLPQKK